ncbi:MAG: HmuY family protein [Bacteroidota bacterium]
MIVGFILFLSVTHAQELVSTGPSYGNMVFYSFQEGTIASHAHTTWDIAFAVTPGGGGVFVNEAAGIDPRGGNMPEVKLYLPTGTDYATVDTTGMTRIFNNEVDWNEGGFNHVKSAQNPFDLGWGNYNPESRNVNGSRVFVLKLRDDTFKKIEIQSLISGVYTFRYADLDGNNEEVKTLSKSDYPGKSLAFFSIVDGNGYDFEPESWDLMFTPYTTPIAEGPVTLDYQVMGVLSGVGVEVARLEGVDPDTVNYINYEDQYSDTLDVIGYDWKSFDRISFEWIMPSDRVYFVKTIDNNLWKLIFTDFEGSTTGVTTIEKSLETTLTNTNDFSKNFESFTVYPNPTAGEVNLAFELKTNVREGLIQIYNSYGQLVKVFDTDFQTGLNVKRMELNLPAGLYQVALRVDNELITRSLIIGK